MKTLFLIVSLLLASTSYGSGIEFFKGSWQEALAKSRQEQKLLFVDVYTDWCGPCKQMDKNVFPLASVGNFFNQNFINIKINAEEGEGVEIANQYHVDGFPTYLFIDGNGDVSQRYMGAMEAGLFLELAREVNDGGFDALLAEYEQGKRDAEFIRQLALRAKAMQESLDREVSQRAGQVFDRLAEEYFAVKKSEDFMSVEGFAMIELCLASKGRGNKITEQVFSHPEKFAEFTSPLRVSQFIVDNNEMAIVDSALAGSDSYKQYWQQRQGTLARHYRQVSDKNPDFSSLSPEILDTYVAVGHKDWQGYMDMTRTSMEAQYGPVKEGEGREEFIIFNLMFLSEFDPAAMAYLEPLAKQRFEESASFQATSNYVDILAQLNRLDEAKVVCRTALKSEKLVDESERQFLRDKLKALDADNG